MNDLIHEKQVPLIFMLQYISVFNKFKFKLKCESNCNTHCQRTMSSLPLLPTFNNVDVSLHDPAQRKQLEEWTKYSKKTGKVLLHSVNKVKNDKYSYGYPASFTGKVESYLRYNGIPYELITNSSVQFALPARKIPWITYNNMHTSDSTIILQRLNSELNIDNDSHLTPKQRGISIAFNRAMDNFYWIDIYRRYMSEKNFKLYCKYGFHFDPDIETERYEQYKERLHKKLVDQLNKQGMGRFDGNTVYYKACKMIDSVLDFKGDNKFFFGNDKMSEIDFSLYSQLGSMYSLPETMLYPNVSDNVSGKLPRKNEVLKYLNDMENVLKANEAKAIASTGKTQSKL